MKQASLGEIHAAIRAHFIAAKQNPREVFDGLGAWLFENDDDLMENDDSPLESHDLPLENHGFCDKTLTRAAA